MKAEVAKMKSNQIKRILMILMLVTMMALLMLTGCGGSEEAGTPSNGENIATEEETVADENEFDPWAYFWDHSVIGLSKEEAEAKIGDLEELMSEGGGMWYGTEDNLFAIFPIAGDEDGSYNCSGMAGYPEQLLGLEADVTLEEISAILGVEFTTFDNTDGVTVGGTEYAGSFNYKDSAYDIHVMVYDEEWEGHNCRVSIYK